MFLIYGANGWIGKQFCEILDRQNIQYVRGMLRIDDKNVRNEIIDIKPTNVVSLTGRTSGEFYNTIDYLENIDKIKDNLNDNLYGPINLAFICKELGIHYTYMGTGCIFNYDEIHNDVVNGFNETDEPNFFGSAYSNVKGVTDKIMHYFDNVLNVRIRMPITDNILDKKNFISKIITYDRICSIPNSMTVLPDLLPIMIDMIIKNKSGTINLTNPGVIDHNKILSFYKEYIDNDFTWENFDINQQNAILKSKRSNNYLDTSYLTSMYQVDDIETSVRKLFERIKDNIDINLINKHIRHKKNIKIDRAYLNDKENVSFNAIDKILKRVNNSNGFIFTKDIFKNIFKTNPNYKPRLFIHSNNNVFMYNHNLIVNFNNFNIKLDLSNDNNIKTMILIIYSERPDYIEMKKIYSSYMKTMKKYIDNFDYYFITYSPSLGRDYIVNEDDKVIKIKGEESFIPGVLDKTIRSMELIKDRDFNFLVRTNISTIIDIPKLNSLFQEKPDIQYGGGTIFTLCWKEPIYGIVDDTYFGTMYAGGTSIILSKDKVIELCNNKSKLNYKLIDDVSIGLYFQYMKDSIYSCTEFHLNNADNTYPNGIFYRNKHADRIDDARNMLIQAKQIFADIKKQK